MRVDDCTHENRLFSTPKIIIYRYTHTRALKKRHHQNSNKEHDKSWLVAMTTATNSSNNNSNNIDDDGSTKTETIKTKCTMNAVKNDKLRISPVEVNEITKSSDETY